MILQSLLTYGHSVSRYLITIEYFHNEFTFYVCEFTRAHTKVLCWQHCGDLRSAVLRWVISGLETLKLVEFILPVVFLLYLLIYYARDLIHKQLLALFKLHL